MTENRPAPPMPGWMLRTYQGAIVVIALVYVLLVAVLLSTGLLANLGPALKLLGQIFFAYLAPGTFMLSLATGLAWAGKRPGPAMAGAAVLAAVWSVVAGYTLVLT